MGIVAVEKADELIWLGRYSERVYTTIKEFYQGFDTMIDEETDSHTAFCRRLNIPDIYENAEDFTKRYPFDTGNPDSIFSNLYRAYDNAIVLREEITSEALSYIQMAIYQMKKTRDSEAPLLGLQKVLDDILAFWGCIEDTGVDDLDRYLIIVGRRLERLDLYLRFDMPETAVKREYERLLRRINLAGYPYREDELRQVGVWIAEGKSGYKKALESLERVF